MADQQSTAQRELACATRVERHGYALFSRVGATYAEYIIERNGVAEFYVGPGNQAGDRDPDELNREVLRDLEGYVEEVESASARRAVDEQSGERPLSVPRNRRSGGTPYDDASLCLERCETLAAAITDCVDDDRVPRSSLTQMLELELEYMRAALHQLGGVHPTRAESEVVLDEKRRARPPSSVDDEQVSREEATTEFDPIGSPQNPISAFLMATQPLGGSCYCNDASFHRGRDLVAIMAAQFKEDVDDTPTLRLSGDQCADVLGFLASSQASCPAEIPWTGGTTDDDVIRKYRGDPSYGLHLIVGHVRDQLLSITRADASHEGSGS